MKPSLIIILFSFIFLTACATSSSRAPDALEPLPYPTENGAQATASKMISPAY